MPLLALSWRSRKSPPARGGVAQSAGVVGEAFASSPSFATRRRTSQKAVAANGVSVRFSAARKLAPRKVKLTPFLPGARRDGAGE
jgi:hypothetical protein